MSKKAEQSNDQSSENEKDFNSLSLEQMKESINKEAQESENQEEDQGQQNSEENQEENAEENNSEAENSEAGESSEEEEGEDTSDNSESESKDQSDKQNKSKPEPVSREEYEKLQKSYKSLQREFTKRNQARGKEQQPEAKAQEGNKKPSVIDQIRSKNPEAAKLFEAVKEEAKAEAKADFEKELGPLKDKFTVREQTENMRGFAKAIDEFSKSELAELTPEIEARLNDMFEDRSTLEEAIKTNPNLFAEIKKEVISENFLKAAELVNKKKSADPKQRVKEIANAKVVTKSKSSNESKDFKNDLGAFKKLPLAEMRKHLPRAEE